MKKKQYPRQSATGKRGAKRKYLRAEGYKRDEIDCSPIAERSVSNRELRAVGGWQS